MNKSDVHGISKSKVDRPIILIHGFLGTPSDWDPFLTAWQSEAGVNASPCVTIDLLDVARPNHPAPDPNCSAGPASLAGPLADLSLGRQALHHRDR